MGFRLLVAAALAGACAGDDPMTSFDPEGPPSATSGPTTAAPASSSPTSTSAPPEPGCDPSECSVRELADRADVLLGAAVRAEYLDEPDYRATLLRTFNSVTPEIELKWNAVHPAPGEWNFGPVDEIVALAREHDLEVKGHALVWDQEELDSTPDWVLDVDEPDELREVVTDHFATLFDRYGADVDRWDVVNEPLEGTGGALYDSHFRQVLGAGYIGELFRIADALAPGEQLWLNEAFTEYDPEKAAALVEVVGELVADGIPVDGVGLQGHLVLGTVEGDTLRALVADLEALGVEVAITELDVAVLDGPEPFEVQADVYRDAVTACFENDCDEITTWGFTDRYTWITGLLGEDRSPLPFDVDYRPKPALDAIREELVAVAAER